MRMVMIDLRVLAGFIYEGAVITYPLDSMGVVRRIKITKGLRLPENVVGVGIANHGQAILLHIAESGVDGTDKIDALTEYEELDPD